MRRPVEGGVGRGEIAGDEIGDRVVDGLVDLGPVLGAQEVEEGRDQPQVREEACRLVRVAVGCEVVQDPLLGLEVAPVRPGGSDGDPVEAVAAGRAAAPVFSRARRSALRRVQVR